MGNLIVFSLLHLKSKGDMVLLRNIQVPCVRTNTKLDHSDFEFPNSLFTAPLPFLMSSIHLQIFLRRLSGDKCDPLANSGQQILCY